jgi:hypothetical protein
MSKTFLIADAFDYLLQFRERTDSDSNSAKKALHGFTTAPPMSGAQDPVQTMKVISVSVISLVFSANGQQIAPSLELSTVRINHSIWDTVSGKCLKMETNWVTRNGPQFSACRRNGNQKRSIYPAYCYSFCNTRVVCYRLPRVMCCIYLVDFNLFGQIFDLVDSLFSISMVLFVYFTSGSMSSSQFVHLQSRVGVSKANQKPHADITTIVKSSNGVHSGEPVCKFTLTRFNINSSRWTRQA